MNPLNRQRRVVSDGPQPPGKVEASQDGQRSSKEDGRTNPRESRACSPPGRLGSPGERRVSLWGPDPESFGASFVQPERAGR
jgi:hypothetical protein